jgi:hypothetical protein
MRNRKVIQALASLVTLGSVIAMVITFRGGFSPGIESQPHQAAGWSMARQTLSLLKPGGQVLVITRDTTEFKNPATDIQLASFKKEMKRAKVSISAVQALQTDALRPMEVPSGDFMNWIHNSPEGSVIVSFMGPPVLSAPQRKQLGEIKTAIVAFCPGSWPDRISLRSLFEQDLLDAAIVSRRNQPSSATKPHNMQAWFDQNFMLVTAANVGDQLAALEKHTP